MIKSFWKLTGIILLLMGLVLPLSAQNTKGDRPANTRETRFQKSTKTKKVKAPKKRRIRPKRTTSSLRKYRPRKDTKGGERAARPLTPLRTTRPDRRPHNVFPQSGPYVNNPSKKPRRIEGRSSASAPRNAGPRVSRPARNVYPQSRRYLNYSSTPRRIYSQSGRFVNHSSTAGRKPPRDRKIRPRSASRSFIARRSINAWANFPRPKRRKERAYKGDISGRPIRRKNFETQRPSVIERSRTGKRLSSTPTLQKRNVYPQGGRYAGRGPRSISPPPAVSNRSTLARLNRMQSGPREDPRKKRRVRPKSATRPYIARRSTNVWARYPRPKGKGERAVTTDLAGKPLRTKNFETPRPDVLVNPTARPYERSKRLGDRPYDGKVARVRSRSRTGRAWVGDITNRRIRRNFSSKRTIEGEPILSPEKRRVGMRDQGEGYTGNIKLRRSLRGGGSVSGSNWNNKGRAVRTKPPGMGGWGLSRYRGFLRRDRKGLSDQGEEYTGSIRSRKSATRDKAAGYSGNIPYRPKGFRDQGEEYTGNIKTRRPLKGGGSVSGKLWNNDGRAVPTRSPGIGGKGVDKYQGNIRFGRKEFRDQGEEYTGSIKTRRPPKGGGSVSFRHWNNNEKPVPARTPGIGSRGIDKYQGNIRFGRREYRDQGEEYTGAIKAKKPVKGGGSISGHWNNQGRPIPARTPGVGGRGVDRYQGNIRFERHEYRDQGEEYTGAIKARKPLKGGGSVSGKHWNNQETAIVSKTPSKSAIDAGRFSGNLKARRAEKGGGSISGKLWNNRNTAIASKLPANDQGVESRGNQKDRREFVRNPNADDAALKAKKPSRNTYATAGLQIKVKGQDHGRLRNAPPGSLPVFKPSKSSMRASEFARSIKQTKDYTRNPNSVRDALWVRAPGKAFARAADYHGNIKLKKIGLFEKRQLHPDAKFVKTNKNNVAEERGMVTNFKLWWARLFRKNETQPDHLKEKNHKPRYDKGEKGLWYD